MIGNGTEYLRTYFKCSKSDRGCPATLHLDQFVAQTIYTPHEMHNHAPPDKAPLIPSVRSFTKDLIKVGITPGSIHKKLILEAAKGTISTDQVPSQQQIEW